MAGRFKALIEEKAFIYIHNDLENAAYYFRDIVEKKLEAGGEELTIFDRMACMVMLAFTFEAQLNFMGFKLVGGWQERQGRDKKIEQVFQKLGIAPDWTTRPFSSLSTLKEVRDALAHGKPEERHVKKEVEAEVGELDGIRADVSQEWQKICTTEAVKETYDDVDVVWRMMRDKAGMDFFDTMTRAERGLTALGPVEEPQAEK